MKTNFSLWLLPLVPFAIPVVLGILIGLKIGLLDENFDFNWSFFKAILKSLFRLTPIVLILIALKLIFGYNPEATGISMARFYITSLAILAMAIALWQVKGGQKVSKNK